MLGDTKLTILSDYGTFILKCLGKLELEIQGAKHECHCPNEISPLIFPDVPTEYSIVTRVPRSASDKTNSNFPLTLSSIRKIHTKPVSIL
jgi:hypothetical protein